MRSLIDILDFSVEELDELIQIAIDIIENPKKYSKATQRVHYNNRFDLFS